MADNPEKRAELIDHLAELRSRLVRSALYVTCGAIAAWFVYPFIYDWLTSPMSPLQNSPHAKVEKFMFTTPFQPFMLQMQVSLIAGLVLALPFLVVEIWGFVSPGLKPNEKKPLKWIAPLSTVLFAGGVTLAYFILPWGFRWFAKFVPPNAEIRPSVPDTMRFVVLMLLAFGVVFELPVFLMLLAKVGILSSRSLLANWRYWVVGITMGAAIICPSNDLPSMIAMAIPLLILWCLSIFLVKLVEKKPRKE